MVTGGYQIRIAGAEDRAAVFALRTEVFVEEQHVPPEIEVDAEDPHALHILAEQDGVVVGCARVLFTLAEAHIGRLAVKREWRSQGIGGDICRFILSRCREMGYTCVWLHAQLHAVAFYEELGFRTEGETFEEAGIPHIKMTAYLS